MKHLKECQKGAAFSTACMVYNYLLINQFNFYGKKVSEFNAGVADYWQVYEDAAKDEYNDFLQRKIGLRYEVKLHGKTNKNATNYFSKMNKFMNESDDIINGEWTKYCICASLALIQMGFGKKRMQRLDDLCNELFSKCVARETSSTKLRQELESKGVFIEWPFDHDVNFDEIYDMHREERIIPT